MKSREAVNISYFSAPQSERKNHQILQFFVVSSLVPEKPKCQPSFPFFGQTLATKATLFALPEEIELNLTNNGLDLVQQDVEFQAEYGVRGVRADVAVRCILSDGIG